MKNMFTLSKNIKIAVAAGTLALLSLLSINAIATEPGGNIHPITTDGNANSAINRLQLAPKNHTENAATFGSKLFRLYGSSTLDNIIGVNDAYFEDIVHVGYQKPTANTETLQVNGTIMLKGLVHPNCVDAASCASIPDEHLCTNDFGRLTRCTATAPVS